MQSHRGTQTHLVSSQDDEIDNEGLMAFFQEHLYPGRSPQENGTERTVDEEEERVNEEEEEKQDEKEHEEEQGGESLISSSLVSSLCHEVGDYSNQSSSWSYRDNEAGDDFDRVASTSSQPYQSQSSYHDNRPNSASTNHHSIVSLSFKCYLKIGLVHYFLISFTKYKMAVLTGNGSHI